MLFQGQFTTVGIKLILIVGVTLTLTLWTYIVVCQTHDIPYKPLTYFSTIFLIIFLHFFIDLNMLFLP